MSEIVQELAFNQLHALAKVAGEEGVVAVAAHSSATSLTEGKEYRICMDSGQSLFFLDDSSIPVYLIYPDDMNRFRPIVDVREFVERIADARGRVEHRVQALINELRKISVQPTDLKAGDIVVFTADYAGAEDKPYIVAKLLTRDEMRLVGQVADTLMAHDLLVYHGQGEATVSILSSHKVQKIGSLEEWGMEPLDPALVEKLTVFDAVKPLT